MNWYQLEHPEKLDSPAFLIHPNRIDENIDRAIALVGSVDRLRPHIKTTKTPKVIEMMMGKGIYKFKCATIAEAEVLGRLGAPDVLLAYQPVGPKVERLRQLTVQYPSTTFSALVDNAASAWSLNISFETQSRDVPAGVNNSSPGTKNPDQLDVFIDLNVGQDRTGVPPSACLEVYQACKSAGFLNLRGLHVYDGHIRDADFLMRKQRVEAAFEQVEILVQSIDDPLSIVAGGSPSFSVHCHRPDVECSPGTFVYWDYGYSRLLKEQPFEWAALVFCRVISKLDNRKVCVDLGHKAIASENPFPRVYFLNAPEVKQIGHSEEHLVLEVAPNSLAVGDVLYGVPVHVCPTCNLYDKAHVVVGGKIIDKWPITGRDRIVSV